MSVSPCSGPLKLSGHIVQYQGSPTACLSFQAILLYVLQQVAFCIAPCFRTEGVSTLKHVVPNVEHQRCLSRGCFTRGMGRPHIDRTYVSYVSAHDLLH